MYALRSYFYLLIHTIGAFLPWTLDALDLVPMTKISIFYGVRLFLAFSNAAANTYLLRSTQKKFGSEASQLLQLFLIVTPGMFISSSAFLPSTFAMICYSLVLGAWMRGQLVVALYMCALSAIVGWPFSLLVGVPLALFILVRRGVLFAVGHGVLSLLFFLAPSVLVDSYLYGKLVIAPAQIVLYNVFGHAGPELYGVEPWYYYLLNGFLNLNFVLPLALAAPFCILLWGWKSSNFAAARDTLIMLSGAYIWLLYMSLVPHKEERFLFVIYPWLCVAAALALSSVSRIFSTYPKLIGSLIALLLLVIVAVSVSRTASMYFNYEAPNSLYTHLHRLETDAKIEIIFDRVKAQVEANSDKMSSHNHHNFEADLNRQIREATRVTLFSKPHDPRATFDYVCVGKEWYRFATHFFLPSNMRLGFIRDGFDGQLPQFYGTGEDSLRRIPPNFNDLNQDEPSRYMNLDNCKYWVNFFETESDAEAFKTSANGKKWEAAFIAPFLSTAHSPNPLARAFYIPNFSEEHNVYGQYTLLRRRAMA